MQLSPILYYRLKNGKRAIEVYQECKIPKPTYYRYESLGVPPCKRNLFKLSLYFDVSYKILAQPKITISLKEAVQIFKEKKKPTRIKKREQSLARLSDSYNSMLSCRWQKNETA